MDSTIRVFALIVGIDQYKAGPVWNLESCVDDAQNVHRWLRKDLKVPVEQICMLLDKQATKENIEKCFSSHLIQNADIKRGDAIVIYFACHGSTIHAPTDWFHKGSVSGTAEVLCSYDFGQRGVAGISDRSLHGMLLDLSKAKGDNITVILDSCCSPLQSPGNIRDRRRTRYTPPEKISSQDLVTGLWPAAPDYPRDVGFCHMTSSFILLAACSPGEKAVEGKEGGKFTSALLETARDGPLHNATYTTMLRHIRLKMGEGQRPLLAGLNVKRPIFDAVPFIPDQRLFITDSVHDPKTLRIGLGSVHGVVEGTEFSLHSHNYCGSCNPSIASMSATHVYPTWSFGHVNCSVPPGSWAQIRRWNNRRSFSLRSKKSPSLLKRRSGASLGAVARALLLLPRL
ncbi:caspase domain-containing protein [Mycena vulgaris]|nr:caspase domain-containing protein [Mycena vulgaris]